MFYFPFEILVCNCKRFINFFLYYKFLYRFILMVFHGSMVRWSLLGFTKKPGSSFFFLPLFALFLFSFNFKNTFGGTPLIIELFLFRFKI